MTTTATGKHHGAATDPVQLMAVQHLNAAAATVLHQQLGDPHATAMLQPRALLHPLPQHIHQGAAGAVLNMQHPAMTVGRFQRRGQGIAGTVEGHAELLKPLDATRCLIHQQPHGISIAKPCSRAQRVLSMTESAVFRSGHRCDAALGPAAGRASSGVAVAQQHRQA